LKKTDKMQTNNQSNPSPSESSTERSMMKARHATTSETINDKDKGNVGNWSQVNLVNLSILDSLSFVFVWNKLLPNEKDKRLNECQQMT
jgi:hypothetical protein